MIFEPKKDPGFSFPCEANPEFDFDENAESERLAKIQNTWLKDLLSRLPCSAWFIYYSRILRSPWISACCLAGTVVSSSCTLPYRVYIIIFVSAKYSEAG